MKAEYNALRPKPRLRKIQVALQNKTAAIPSQTMTPAKALRFHHIRRSIGQLSSSLSDFPMRRPRIRPASRAPPSKRQPSC